MVMQPFLCQARYAVLQRKSKLLQLIVPYSLSEKKLKTSVEGNDKILSSSPNLSIL